MFGGIAAPTPPQHGPTFHEIVKPRLPDLHGRQVALITVIRQRSQKCKCARNIVVCDDQRNAKLLVDVVVDLPKLTHDAFIGPSFKRTPQINADDFAKYSGVYAFDIVSKD